MRLQMGPDGKVNREIAIPLLRRAFELGVTYFDTAIMYCGGDSQRVLGEAMEGIRDKVVLSTKNHYHASPADVWRSYLDQSLEFLRTSWIDVYNFHGLSWAAYEQHMRGPSGKLELARKAKSEGKIRHICCSFHDSCESLIKLAETGDFDAITLQYNLLNRELEPGIARARELGVGIVIMGPVGGGRLGVESQRIRELTRNEVQSTPEAALRFVLANPGVNVALSGMSTFEMLDENVRVVSGKKPFTPEQIAAIDREAARVKTMLGVKCTACGYCLPCAFGVDIPENFRVYNEFKMYGLTANAQAAYARLVSSASACAECGACLPKCPQRIAIPETMAKIVSELDSTYDGFGGSVTLRGALTGGLNARIVVRNLRAAPLKAGSASLSIDDGCAAEPSSIAFPEIPPLGSVAENAAIRIPDGVGLLEARVDVVSGDETRSRPLSVPFLLAPRGRWRRHVAKLRPADFGGKAAVADAYGYAVSLMHDERALYARVDVRSPMQGLAAAGETRGSRLELYVDMRPPATAAANAYEEGAEQFMLLLSEAHGWSRSGRTYTLDLRHRRTAEGCELSLALPFGEFRKAGAPPPREIGLDWMLVAAAPDKTEVGCPTYGRRQGLWQSPRLFARAFLE